MDVAALIQATAGILGSQAQSVRQTTTALQGSSAGLAPADKAALLANPAVAYQIAQNPFLASSLLRNAYTISNLPDTKPTIDPDVQDLADHFGLEERIARELDAELKNRPATWEGDLVALWDILEDARNPPGLLRLKIEEMQANTFIGQPTMDKDIKEFKRKYKLDDQATRKLAEVLQKRPETREQDVEIMHRHLETSNKPSARVMMIFGKWKTGEPLPQPDKRIAPGSYLDRLEREREHRAEEGRGRRSRDRRRNERSRDRNSRRSRSRGRRRSRSPNYNK